MLGRDQAAQASRAELLSAMDEAAVAAMPAYLDALAASYARRFTLAQLTDIAIFMESPAGQAWSSLNKDHMEDDMPDLVQFQKAIQAGVHDRLCARTTCPPAGSPQAAPPPAPAK